MGLFKADPPEPPNPYATAAAQTGTNVATAVANSYLSHVNQNTPQGSLNYNQSGSYNWADPSSGQTYNIPTFTATQTLSDAGQRIQGQQEATQYNLAGMANAQSGRVSNLLSNELDIGGAPQRGNPQWLTDLPRATTYYDRGGPIQTSLGNYGQQQTGFGGAGDITRSYGPEDNFSADRQRVEESLYGRLDPQLARDRSRIEQRLADQGIRYGSGAYTQAMDDYNRQSTDARLAVTAAGGAEQQRMNQMAAQLAAFQNSAQGQAYQQELGRGQFANAAQEQNYQQGLGAGTFANQAQAQQYGQNAQLGQFYNTGLAQQLAQNQSYFNASQAARNQYMQEQYAYRNQPINEISALLSGSQVNQPNFINAPQSQIPTTDVGGLINQGFNQQMQVSNQQSQNANALMGGVLGLGAGALRGGYISDERQKKDIAKVGTVFAYDENANRPKVGSVLGNKKELPIYEYSYKGEHDDGQRHVGPMAQDVEQVDRTAVQEHDGVKRITGRGAARLMGNILRAA